ncbi:MAG: hypothetical protein WAM61_20245, partial [Desulfobacterales bacterium]
EQSCYDQAREEFENIIGHLDSKEASAMTHSELERELEKKGRELCAFCCRSTLITAVPANATNRFAVQTGQNDRGCVFRSESWKRCSEPSR